jgi:hypothetical protein
MPDYSFHRRREHPLFCYGIPFEEKRKEKPQWEFPTIEGLAANPTIDTGHIQDDGFIPALSQPWMMICRKLLSRLAFLLPVLKIRRIS